MKTYLRILAYVKPYWGRIILHAVSMVISIIFLASSVAFLDIIIKLLFSGGGASVVSQVQGSPFAFLNGINKYIISIIEQNDNNLLPALAFSLIFVVSLNVAGNLFRFASLYFMNFIRTKVIEDIRKDTFNKISKLQISYFEGERRGDIMTRMTSDLTMIEGSVVTSLESIIRDPFTLISFLYLMIVASWQLTLFIFILLPLSALIISFIGKSLKRDSFRSQEKLSWIMSVIDEFTSGIRVVKAFNAEKYVKRIFGRYNAGYSFFARRQQNKQKSIPLISESLGIITMGVFLWFGGKLVFQGHLQESLIFTFVLLFQQIMQPAKKLFSAWGNIMKGVASGERLFQLYDAPVLIKEIDKPISVSDLELGIAFDHVYFAYNKEYVLKDINLEIPKGKIYALVGPSGSGKSTFMELILRFYDVKKGAIRIDGKDVRHLSLYDLRNLIAIVTQEPILFNDSIANNIAFGLSNISEDQIIQAAKVANAHEFIMAAPMGYNTMIGDRGGLLSGGQRQRISIARAALKNPKILLLDEATSSLDTNSEHIVQDALYKLMEKRTAVVSAHRLSTIQNADQIIVLDNGEIVQMGTHRELINTEGVYKALCELQQLEK